MITLRHNVRRVRERFERFTAEVRKVPEQVSQPDFWTERAKAEAIKVLSLTADDKNRHLVEKFAETVTVLSFSYKGGATMIWTMEQVKGLAMKLSDLTREQKQDIFDRRRELISREQLYDWVAQAKDISDEDPADLDDIVDRIAWILFGPSSPDKDQDARNLLFGSEHPTHENYMAEFMGLIGDAISADELRKWMRNVLRAWRRLILDELPPLIRSKIQEAWKESKG